ncbi:MAG: endonuclease/exonuclease/phosphatase family protein [Bacteroidales bacterium]|nr:endonuclease/exonuclease/phosphatase family protein [Bacteroidales bacterium]MCI6903779.1 endonuclease/exonuclease/phosphatase family protein [Bacteroidales bacterium]MDY3734785.1 endonuclease/exonuclease/phosphatase family protein [Sodaliphilus sp.]
MMHFDKKSYLYRIIKVSAIVVTALLSVVLIYAAYSGTTHPADSRIAPVAVLAFPFLLALEVMIGMLWLIVHSWRVSLIVWVAILISWPSVRVVAPLNMFPHTYTPKEDSTKFKVLTFNVENFKVSYYSDKEKEFKAGQATARYILKQDADVVLLQEASLSADFNDLPFMDSLKKVYPYRDHGYHDQVILSKHPYQPVIDDSIKNGFASPDNFLNGYHFYARAFDVLVPGHKVRFFNLHLHSIQLSNDDKQFYVDLTKLKTKDKPSEAKQASKTIFAKLTNAFRQHAQEAALLRQVINQSDANVIVCGDFNDVPMSYAYRKIMGNDMTDAWVKCGFGPTATYHNDRLFFKIDHVLYRGDMEAVEMHRHKEGSSDHYPLVTTFVWKR